MVGDLGAGEPQVARRDDPLHDGGWGLAGTPTISGGPIGRARRPGGQVPADPLGDRAAETWSAAATWTRKLAALEPAADGFPRPQTVKRAL